MLGEDAPSQLPQQIASTQASIAHHQDRLEAATGDRKIGTTFATSGYKICDSRKCHLDWGLIELLPGRDGLNKIPESSSTVTSSVEVTELDSKISKHGRTTELTQGRVNPAESYVRFEGTQFETISMETLVVSSSRMVPFSAEGDSGSWVLDNAGSLVGMLWGGFTSREGTFVTPITAITENIARQTGYSVRLPGGAQL